ncbi:MAG: CBS domain-containing protein [Kamptonema sp. SIO4C4]|nr:CBS domain-containing protein [Kamptonema sp. SIO4C4]
MDVILCHQTADFDALGAAVGLSRLYTGSKVVLTGGAHPGVNRFLRLYRDELALMERRSVDPKQLQGIFVVDTQHRDRLGKAQEWFALPQLHHITLYDHHLEAHGDIPATQQYIADVGATTTLVVEQLQHANLSLTAPEATVMALGIHVDTSSLTVSQSTSRDALALAWLMLQGANLASLREYLNPQLSPQLQQLLSDALQNLETQTQHGYQVGWVFLPTERFVPGLSSVVEHLLELTQQDALLLVSPYWHGGEESNRRITVIARSRIPNTNLNQLLSNYGGGGHAQAASATLKNIDPKTALTQLLEDFIAQIPHPLTARDLMSSPVRTIRPQVTIGEAQRILLRYGHSGLSVVDEADRLVGIISRRDLDIALHHGFSHAPVKGYMSRNLQTITPDTPLPAIESLMVTYDVGRLPVLDQDKLLGIVTRTDILRQRQPQAWGMGETKSEPKRDYSSCLIPQPKALIPSPIWQLLNHIAQEAENRGWHLYVVGGVVRDLILQSSGLSPNAAGEQKILQDIDLVVDGFHRTAQTGAGVELAKAVQQQYPEARLEVHGDFQTAALLWHKDPELDSLALDIATARTEFYPYPAANPEVEASSIRQDLYRRDFTINALAIRLTAPREGELLDFFGGLLDLRSRFIRVLHPNSFIEDPTRIYRAVRFAVRLGFQIEAQTQDYIHYAIESGVYDRSLAANKAPALTTRLKTELKYILAAQYWKPALQLLNQLEALRCLHPQLSLNPSLWWQIRLLDRCLRRFDPTQHHFTHWHIRLEVLLATLPQGQGYKVAQNLQLTAESIQRLRTLPQVQQEITEFLSQSSLHPSTIYHRLKPYKFPLLVLLAVRTPRPIRQLIWQYLIHWSQVSPLLNGNDLKQLGYKPGPQYREMLDHLLSATLDGTITTREEAEAFLAKHYG